LVRNHLETTAVVPPVVRTLPVVVAEVQEQPVVTPAN
jgi:hypothetical protein